MYAAIRIIIRTIISHEYLTDYFIIYVWYKDWI